MIKQFCKTCNKEFLTFSSLIKKGKKFCSKNWHYTKSYDYRLWRKNIFERDDYSCQKCFMSKGQYITAHHIKSWAKYPELRFDIDNGITLCEECHKLTDNYKGRGNKI